jgi:OHS family lactose permease-like MFS transporter
VLLFLFAPFFLFVFAPLLKANIWLGALSGGLYIGFVFSAGSGAIEAYIERVSRNSFFEYGKARMFGCLGWGCAPRRAGSVRHRSIVCFLDGVGSGAAAVVAGGRKTETNQTAQVMNALGANQPQITAKTVFNLFRQRRMWMFILYVIGVACVYDVFDQQFATFFKTFFATPQEGTRAFGFATTAGKFVTPSSCSVRRGSLTVSARKIRC